MKHVQERRRNPLDLAILRRSLVKQYVETCQEQYKKLEERNV